MSKSSRIPSFSKIATFTTQVAWIVTSALAAPISLPPPLQNAKHLREVSGGQSIGHIGSGRILPTRAVAGVSNLLGDIDVLSLHEHDRRSVSGVDSLLGAVNVLATHGGHTNLAAHDYDARKVSGITSIVGDIDVLHGRDSDTETLIAPFLEEENLAARAVSGVADVIGDLDILASSESGAYSAGNYQAYGNDGLLRRGDVGALPGRSVNGVGNVLGDIDLLNTHYTDMQKRASNLRTLAAQCSGDTGPNEYAQQQAVTTAQAYHASFLGFQTVLGQLGADKGLLNYDKTKELPTLIKNIVNLNKGVFEATSELADSLPVLGPLLGPVVYEIKCVLDLTLDAVENLTDAVLNTTGLSELLGANVQQASQATCVLVQLAGVCI